MAETGKPEETGRKRFPIMLLLPPLLFAALAGLFIWGMNREDPNALPSTREGSVAPGLALQKLGDLPLLERAALDAPGVKLVNFWASWCQPCRAEHPNLMWLREQGITLYGVNYKDKPENALGFLESLGNPFILTGADNTGRNGIEWGIYGVPETFIIDGNGVVVKRFAGPITQRVLQGTILPAIEEARKAAP